MKWQATALLFGLTLGVAQPISAVVLPNFAPVVTAKAAADADTTSTDTDDADEVQGSFGTSHFYMKSDGVLHFGAGTFDDLRFFANYGDESQMGRVLVTDDGVNLNDYGVAIGKGANTHEAALIAAKKITRIVLDGPVTAPVNSNNLFDNLPNLTGIDNLNLLNTTQVTSMDHMLAGLPKVTSLDVSKFDTSRVTTLASMFSGDKILSSVDVSNFETPNLINAGYMFNRDAALKEVNFAKATFSKSVVLNSLIAHTGVEKIGLKDFAGNTSGIFNQASALKQFSMDFSASTQTTGNLPNVKATDEYTGKWRAVGKGTVGNPLGQTFDSGADVFSDRINQITGMETYVWEPVTPVIEPTTPDVDPATPVVPTESAQPVTVHYVDNDGKKLADDVTLTGKLGASYQAEELGFSGYKLASTDGQAKGTFTTNQQSVTFHYAPDLVSGGDADTIAPLTSVVYATKKISLYSSKNFSKKARKVTYSKQKRTNRPMFVVTGYAKSKQGYKRYKVKDVNHESKTDGKTGYITTKHAYVAPVYYAVKHKKIQVINPKGVNSYKNKALKTHKVKHYKKGQTLNVKKIVSYHLTTRYQLTNGKYVTANKKLVIAK
ncbi:MucBP domain-containing protein [Levilactobacillus lindianensis]|uniref:MucBP domain-containing protein n=1 Tax=Levilactobacillus lindianensis TaxID=2486018 RepID=UPI000F7388A2|nr:MucBP domain-containing protein [Levilactobacillus lindianensis]